MKSLFARTALVAAVLALTLAARAQTSLTLYASDAGAKQLFTLSPTTAAATLVGGYNNNGNMGGLAYDSVHDILFGSDVSTNSLYTINPSTGAATLVGAFGVNVMQALAFDPVTGSLYGAYGNVNTPFLYRINTATGAASAIGALARTVSGLSFDPVTHVLYGSSTGTTPSIFTIDPTTGQTIAQVATTGFNGLSFNPLTGVLFGVSNGGNVIFGGPAEGLYTIDKQTGATSLVGSLSLNNPLDLQFALRTVSTGAAPEPGSLLLAAPGLLLLGGLARRKRVAG